MHFIDWTLIAALVLLAVFAVRRIKKNRGSCCGDCASCRKNCEQHKESQ